ncbi:hypothetical protein D1227_18595 [Henriciella mobilis]|uniref:hypothetical protein n=1 Tax=Henriciella mobilis TaxID=2305467 RepID=UPI000E66B23E|nr:hypothetical protein [Henriciella mobilis]RIJ15506.1 hypothetical protein D1231_12245 [Henriciella mobilis]RIJ18970.1 hypothetical protein D1227_18595 [Henriciella mobilis]
MARLFDAYIIVDWSAASKPAQGANSVWIGALARDARLKFQFQAANPSTRLAARDMIAGLAERFTSRGDKVLIGFDFSLGYPAGTAEAIGLKTDGTPAWQAMHEHLSSKVKEKADNSNTRFAIAAGLNYAMTKGPLPFWGAPARDQIQTLSGTKGDFAKSPVAEYRICEEWVRKTQRSKPKSSWQLYGAGSVGSQALLGIPTVQALRKTLPKSAIWPFETGFEAFDAEALTDTDIVFAEVYPSLVSAKPETGEVADQAQVRALAHHYYGLDESGKLGALFGPPEGLDSTLIPKIVGEEGWILLK